MPEVATPALQTLSDISAERWPEKAGVLRMMIYTGDCIVEAGRIQDADKKARLRGEALECLFLIGDALDAAKSKGVMVDASKTLTELYEALGMTPVVAVDGKRWDVSRQRDLWERRYGRQREREAGTPVDEHQEARDAAMNRDIDDHLALRSGTRVATSVARTRTNRELGPPLSVDDILSRTWEHGDVHGFLQAIVNAIGQAREKRAKGGEKEALRCLHDAGRNLQWILDIIEKEIGDGAALETEKVLWRELGIRRGIVFDEDKWIPALSDPQRKLPVQDVLDELHRQVHALTTAKSASVIQSRKMSLYERLVALLWKLTGVG